MNFTYKIFQLYYRFVNKCVKHRTMPYYFLKLQSLLRLKWKALK